MQNTSLSLLALILDRSVGNIIRMLRVIRLPKAERGPVSWGFVGTLAVTLAYGLIMLFSASYSSGYTKYGDIYHFIKPQAIVAVVAVALVIIGYVAMAIMAIPMYAYKGEQYQEGVDYNLDDVKSVEGKDDKNEER